MAAWNTHHPNDMQLTPIVPAARIYSWKEQIEIPRAFRQSGADLLHMPHYNLPVWEMGRTVVTVHDLILHRYPNEAHILRQLAYRFLFRRAVSQANGRCSTLTSGTAGQRRSLPRHHPKRLVGEPMTGTQTPAKDFLATVAPWVTIVGVVVLSAGASPEFVGIALIALGILLTRWLTATSETSGTVEADPVSTTAQ